MARRAGIVHLVLGPDIPAIVSDPSSASGYGLLVPTTCELSAVNFETMSGEQKVWETRRQRGLADAQKFTLGEQLVSVGQGAVAGQSGQVVVLPSLAELTVTTINRKKTA